VSKRSSSADVLQQQVRRGFWLRTLHQWHWISSALCLVGMLLFALTGLTLNHAAHIEAKPQVTQRQLVLPPHLQQLLMEERDVQTNTPLPVTVARWLSRELDRSVDSRLAEWSEDEIYLSLPGPGQDAWLSIDRHTGEVEYEHTRRGWISYFNDLHKGRNTGPMWAWFIDLFAISCLVFCITGLFLLHLHARQRHMTWPLVGLGLLVPLLIALLLIH